MEAYHCSFHEAMSLTTPQIIMLNHAAWVTHENADRRSKARAERDKREEEERQKQEEEDPFVEEYGCRLSEMSEDDIWNQMRSIGGMG